MKSSVGEGEDSLMFLNECCPSEVIQSCRSVIYFIEVDHVCVLTCMQVKLCSRAGLAEDCSGLGFLKVVTPVGIIRMTPYLSCKV